MKVGLYASLHLLLIIIIITDSENCDFTIAKLYVMVSCDCVTFFLEKKIPFYFAKVDDIFCCYKFKTSNRRKWEESVSATAWDNREKHKSQICFLQVAAVDHDARC